MRRKNKKEIDRLQVSRAVNAGVVRADANEVITVKDLALFSGVFHGDVFQRQGMNAKDLSIIVT
jgi:hypothetical protein